MKYADVEAYPLYWPAAWPRNHSPESSRFDTSLASARLGLIRELELLGARNVVISSNAKLTKSGDIYHRQSRIDDSGVAVYFTLNGEQRCIPCDRWQLLEENMQAVRKTIEALRGIDRWGTPGIVAAAFQGFAALPESTDGSHWWEVLGVSPWSEEFEIESQYRGLAKIYHPDVRNGDAEKFLEIQSAYQQSKSRRRSA